MQYGRASVPFPQRWRVAHCIPTLARGNEIKPDLSAIFDMPGGFG